MLSYKKEDKTYIDLFLAYGFSPVEGFGLNVRYNKINKNISVNGEIPYYVNNVVNFEELERFAKNILELVEIIKQEKQVPIV